MITFNIFYVEPPLQQKIEYSSDPVKEDSSKCKLIYRNTTNANAENYIHILCITTSCCSC